MNSKIEILGPDKYIAPLEQANEGQIAFTHAASVKWIDGRSYRFFVKLFPKSADKGLINEITGYLTANSCNLPQPEKVAIILVPKRILAKEDLDHFNLHQNNYIIGWASVDSGPTPKTLLSMDKIIEFEESLSSLKNWKYFSEMLAFDDWVANQDRNLGNMTISGKNEFKLIDHGNSPISEKWTKEDLLSNQHYQNKMLEHFFPKNTPKSTASEIVKSTDSHPQNFESVIFDLNRWYGEFLDHDSKTKLLEFLKSRAHDGNIRMGSKTGLLVA